MESQRPVAVFKEGQRRKRKGQMAGGSGKREDGSPRWQGEMRQEALWVPEHAPR